MSFQHRLDGLLNKGKAKLQEYQNKNQPPPVNYASKPGGSNSAPPPPIPSPRPQNLPYWKPAFDPSTPVSSLFKQETGAHGWGNNESQNYTDRAENCFFTPDHKLVLSGSVNSSAPDRYTSARLISHQKLDRDRGCLTAVLTAPVAEGIWPAFWLLPAEPFTWPTDGEVDIFESWNGDQVNHSCLHWGQYNGEDWDKHRVVETAVPSMGNSPHEFRFAWEQGAEGKGGRAMWYIDGQAVMKATLPTTMRRMSDWKVIINVAMGGNVCQGRLPRDGTYDFVVHELRMEGEPPGGWASFGGDWERTREGKTM